MILKKQFSPWQVFRYMQSDILLSLLLAVAVFLLHEVAGIVQVKLPFSVVAILGSALAIFLAFRNNNSYNRWWEARTLWGNIINNSRILARQLIASAENAVQTGKVTRERADAYQQEILYRQIGFAHALRLHLRGQQAYETFRHLLAPDEYQRLITLQNIPNAMLLTQGLRIKEGVNMEILGAFDNISIEPTLAGFNTFQGSCERIKYTPLLRQYHFFTRLFLQVFMFTLPFGLIGDFSNMGLAWLMIPIAMLISFVFAVMGKVGEVNEDPFENEITDVPMSAMCNTIERDLKEMLGEPHLPEKWVAEKGYLF